MEVGIVKVDSNKKAKLKDTIWLGQYKDYITPLTPSNKQFLQEYDLSVRLNELLHCEKYSDLDVAIYKNGREGISEILVSDLEWRIVIRDENKVGFIYKYRYFENNKECSLDSIKGFKKGKVIQVSCQNKACHQRKGTDCMGCKWLCNAKNFWFTIGDGNNTYTINMGIGEQSAKPGYISISYKQ